MQLHYNPPMLECTCCHKMKPRTEFYTEAYTDLPTRQCKECINIKRSVVRNQRRHNKFVSKEKIRSMEDVQYGLQDWKDAMLHFNGGCCYCGSREGRAKATKFDREHLVPLSRGGQAIRKNIAPACRKCNRGRGNKPLFQWFRNQSFWTQEREDKVVAWMGKQSADMEGYDE